MLAELAESWVRSRNEDRAGWDSVALPYLPVAYSHAEIDYQQAYAEAEDGSLVLYSGGMPCGIWPLAMKNGIVGPVLPPLFGPVSRKTEKLLVNRCLGIIEGLKSVEPCTPNGVSCWQEMAMRRGSVPSVKHDLYIDLSKSLEEIRSGFSKGHRAAVTAGLRIWTARILTEASPLIWDEFRLLHHRVAGRATRSLRTWDLQQQAVIDGDAFLVYLVNAAGEMVGGGYFAITKDEGCYNVGAYDRSLFSMPLGHVVQYRAIEEMKKRGIRWYRIGERVYQGTEKELHIADFKHGFASHVFPRFQMEHKCQ
jgi:FemAB family protein